MGVLKKRGLRNLFLGIALLAMLVLSACESVGGVDLNQMMKSSLDIESQEGRSSVSIEINLDEELLEAGVLSAEELALVSLLQNITIEFDEIKQQDLMTTSATGKLSLGSLEFPVGMWTNANEMVFQVEGISKPLVMKTGLEELGEVFPGFEEYVTLQVDFAHALMDYVVPVLPNPASIEVENTNITINDEDIPVYKVSAVVPSTEWFGLLEQFAHNLVQDEDGLRALLSELYDLLFPLIEQMAEADPELLDDPTFRMAQNKNLAIELIYEIIKGSMDEMIAEFDEANAEIGEVISQLGEESYVAMDIYVDQELTIRKSDFEAVFKPGEAVDGLVSIKIAGSQEIWSVNEPVTVDFIEYDEFIDPEWDPILPFIESESALAQLLTTFGLNEDVTRVFPDNKALEQGEYLRAYIVNGTTLASSEWLASEWSLHYYYDEEAGILELVDPVSERTITLPIGENRVFVNGEEREVLLGAVDHNGIPFIPLRFVAEEFGAEVEWDGENRIVIITKRYF